MRRLPWPSCCHATRGWMVLLVALLVLPGCMDRSVPAAQEAGRRALEAMLNNDPEGLERFIVPADQRPPSPADEINLGPAGMIALQPCRGIPTDFSDRGISDPPGARLVTAKFTRPCVPARPGRVKDTLGFVTVKVDDRWLVVRLQ